MKHSVTCVFDPQRDALEVVSGLAVDINDMLQTGVVKSGTSETEDNGIDDPEQVVGLVRDEFAAIDAMRMIRKYGKKAPQKAEKAAEKATEVAAPAPSDSNDSN